MTLADAAPGPRERLLATGFRVLEDEGPAALQARRLTAEIGMSTMALYTHFGGVPGLVEALVREGLVRFAAHVRRVPRSEDSMTDLIAGGIAYSEFALRNSQLYRLMFGLTADSGSPWTLPEGVDAFSVLLSSVERTIEDGRLRRQDAQAAARQILSATHGFVLLAIGGFIGDVGEGIRDVAAPMTVNLMVGLGDSRTAAERSMAAAIAASAT